MKTTKSTVFLALAVAACCGRAGATEYHWVGGGADNNWSTPENWSPAEKPTVYDSVVFDANSGSGTAIVDANFPERVVNLTMTASFSGTVELGRPFKVWHTQTLAGGTFTCGEHSFTNGESHANTAPGNFVQTGGVFNAPTRGELAWRPGSATRTLPTPGDTSQGVFNLNGATFAVLAGANNTVTLVVNGYVFNDFKVTGEISSYLVVKGRAVVNGTFIQEGTRCCHFASAAFDQTKDCEILCKGDVTVGNKADGGTLRLILCGDKKQTVRFKRSAAGTYLPRCCGILASNEVADVQFVSEDGWARFGYLNSNLQVSGGATFSELYCATGRLDLSAVDTVEIANYGNNGGARCFGASSVGEIVPPGDVVLRGFMPRIDGRNLVFNDLTFRSWSANGSTAMASMPTYATNTVLGTLRFLGGDGYSPERGGTLRGDKWVDKSFKYGGQYDDSFTYINLYGNAVIDHAGGTGAGGTDAMIRFCSDKDQTIYSTNSLGFPGILVDKPEGTKVRFVTDGTSANIGCVYSSSAPTCNGMLYVNSGSLVVPAEGLVMTNCSYSRVFVAEKGKLESEGEGELVLHTSGSNRPIILRSVQPFERLAIAGLAYVWDDTKNDHVRVTKRLAFYGVNGFWRPDGTYDCSVDLEGDLYVGTKLDRDDLFVNFVGSNVQHYRNDGGANPWRDYTIDKTGGRLVLDTDVDMSHRYATNPRNVDFKAGVLDLNGHSFATSNGRNSSTKLGAGAEILFSNGSTMVCETVAAVPGATLTYCEPKELPADTDDFGGIGVPMLTVTNSLSVAAGMRLGVRPTVRSLERRRVKAVGYKGLSGTLDVANWTVATAAGVKRLQIEHDASAKLVSLSWYCKPDGLLLLLR